MQGINPKSLSHTYIISGDRVSIIEELVHFLENNLGIKSAGNPDFFIKEYDTFFVEDARDIRVLQQNQTLKDIQVFIISAKEITREAQNAFLKITEDPTPNTCFFFVLPDQEFILPTLKSRAVCIEYSGGEIKFKDKAQEFLKANPKERLDIVAEFLPKKNEKIDKEKVNQFLSAIEVSLGEKEFLADVYDVKRKVLAKGVSAKVLLEHLAMVLPF